MLNEGTFMADLDEVICPRCKLGFAPDTATCPICNIPLVSEEWSNETPSPVILTDDLSSLKELRAADLDWIHHLQDKLAEAGIPHRIEVSDPRYRFFSVFVRPEDLLRAKDVDDKVFAVEVPDGEGMPPVEKLDFWSCPGCGNRLGEKDLKCSNCGLVLFQADDWRCSNCDGIVEVNVSVCPHCGCDIDWSKM
jgi:RNA polymerase subunit RPABC4/transcription elongation factor Spt4